jgi:hypothetical protein
VKRGPSKLRKTDLIRAVAGTKAAGLQVTSVKVDENGNFEIVTAQASQDTTLSDFDRWTARHEG